MGVSEPFVRPEKIMVGFGLSMLAVGALLAMLCSVFPPPTGLLLGPCLHQRILSHHPICFGFFLLAMDLWLVAQRWSEAYSSSER